LPVMVESRDMFMGRPCIVPLISMWLFEIMWSGSGNDTSKWLFAVIPLPLHDWSAEKECAVTFWLLRVHWNPGVRCADCETYWSTVILSE